MKDINKTKIEITQTITRNLDEIFEDIVGKILEFHEVEEKVKTKSNEYINISNEYDKIISDINKEKREIEASRSNLKEEEERVLRDIPKHRNEIKTLETKLVNLKNAIKTSEERSKDIPKIESRIKSLELIKSNLDKDIKKTRDEYIKEIPGIEKDLKSKTEEKKSLESQIKALEEKNSIELARVIPTIDELNAREITIKAKEKDLDVIERRYKKLFADQNSGFKV